MRNAECKSSISPPLCGGKPRQSRGLTGRILLFCFAFCILHSAFPATARATPTQEEVFKSIQSNENDTIDGRKLLAVLAGGAGLVIIIVLINNRQQRRELPRTLNHQGKLLRELMKTAGLKNAQIRQLKMLSEELANKDQPVDHLVTLLLCPSLIKKARDRKDRGH
jgi:hypothetical protein